MFSHVVNVAPDLDEISINTAGAPPYESSFGTCTKHCGTIATIISICLRLGCAVNNGHIVLRQINEMVFRCAKSSIVGVSNDVALLNTRFWGRCYTSDGFMDVNIHIRFINDLPSRMLVMSLCLAQNPE